MRLINVLDYSVVEVIRTDDHRYAILSHTWGDGEVLFGDMEHLDSARGKSAWPKVERTCALARGEGIPFVWIDTCCIDKNSSAELTEAINSMFEWYRKAKVCYALLADLPRSPNGDPESVLAKEQLRSDRDLGRCRWFTRGWTLQELIAPKAVEFYDGSWTRRGDKDSLQCEIARLTNIDPAVLRDSEALSAIPVARKMAWSAARETTRVEDAAYCLLGIFDVNLPLIYGEGGKAFFRLQEAIAQSTNDLSLFAWSEDERYPSPQPYYGAFAPSLRQFARCRQLEHITDPLRHDSQSFTMTNRGVEFQTSLKIDYANGDYLMHLYCRDAAVRRPDGRLGVVALRLVKTSSGFARHCAANVFVDDDEATEPAIRCDTWDPVVRPVHVAKFLAPADATRLRRRFHEAFRFKVQAPTGVACEMTTYSPAKSRTAWVPGAQRPSYWDPARSILLTEGYEYFTGLLYITFSSRPKEPVMVLCGLLSSARSPTSSPAAMRKPWVALHPPDVPWWSSGFDPTKPLGDRIDDLEAMIAQNTRMGHPHSLARLGQTIRASVLRGKVLPHMALMKYRRRPSAPKDGAPSHHRLVTVSGTTRESTDGTRIHEILVTLEEHVKPAMHGPLLSCAVCGRDDGFSRNGEEDFEKGVVE